MESWKDAALCSKLYKTEEEQQIFVGFRILKQEQKETSNKAKCFWILELQLKLKLSKLKLETKRKQVNKDKKQKYFWSFCVLENNNKARNYKKKENKTWIYKVQTEYDI